MELSGCRLVLFLAFWGALTIAVGLMAGLINKGCDSDDEQATTTSPDATTSSPSTDPPVDGPWGDPRLPKTIVPVFYDIWLYPDFYYDGSVFYGREDITIRVVEATKYVILHAKLMNVSGTTLHDKDGNSVELTQVFGYEPLEYWVL